MSVQRAFKRALFDFEKMTGIDIFQFFVQSAAANPNILISVMNKVLANKTELNITPSDINRVIEGVSDIFARYIPNKEDLAKALTELRELVIDEDAIPVMSSPVIQSVGRTRRNGRGDNIVDCPDPDIDLSGSAPGDGK